MTMQLGIVAVSIVLAFGYVLRATWKTWFGASKAGCGSGCGKCGTSTQPTEVPNRRIPLNQIR